MLVEYQERHCTCTSFQTKYLPLIDGSNPTILSILTMCVTVVMTLMFLVTPKYDHWLPPNIEMMNFKLLGYQSNTGSYLTMTFTIIQNHETLKSGLDPNSPDTETWDCWTHSTEHLVLVKHYCGPVLGHC